MQFMRFHMFILVLVGLIIAFSVQSVNAEVWIPDNEFDSYFDKDGIYTVIGAVKNSEKYPIIPTIIIRIQDEEKTISGSFTLPIANPSKDIPFKIKFDQISSKNPILEKPQISFVPGPHDYTAIEVEYGSTLVKHKDGHTSGFIVNNGNTTAYGVKVYALVHGKENAFIDVGKSIENIDRLEPGEKRAFSIYPDPLFATQVSYYSCFVIGDDMVIPTFVLKDGERFDFRYKTEGYLTEIKYDDEKDTMMFFARNPWPMKSFANIEFPMDSKSQEFVVYRDGEKIESTQSRDEQDTWHVVFDLEPRSSGQIDISGFVSEKNSESGFDIYYLLIIIPVAAIIAGIIVKRKKSISLER